MKVFAREDDAISSDVAEILHRYRFDHQVDAITSDGRVTISGGVEHRSGAQLIEEVLFRILGVIEVDNQVTWVYDDTKEHNQETVGQMACGLARPKEYPVTDTAARPNGHCSAGS